MASKFVFGTDIREGVEGQIEIETFGNQEMEDFIVEALLNYRSVGTDWNLDFVTKVRTFDIPEEGLISDYLA